MKILSRKQQMEGIKRLNAIRIITDDMNYKAYGEEVKKWAENVEYLADNIIEIANIVYGIRGMQVIDYFVILPTSPKSSQMLCSFFHTYL